MQKLNSYIDGLFNLLTLNNKSIDKMIREHDEELREIDFFIPENTIIFKPIDLKLYHEKINLDNILIRRLCEVEPIANNIDEIRELYENLKEIKERFKSAKLLEVVSIMLPKARIDDFDKLSNILEEYVINNIDVRYITIDDYFKNSKEIIDYYGLDNFKVKLNKTNFVNGLVPEYNKILNLIDKISINRNNIYNNFQRGISGYKNINPDYCLLMEEIFGYNGLYGDIIIKVSEKILSEAFNNIGKISPERYFFDFYKKIENIVEIIKRKERASDLTSGEIVKDIE